MPAGVGKTGLALILVVVCIVAAVALISSQRTQPSPTTVTETLAFTNTKMLTTTVFVTTTAPSLQSMKDFSLPVVGKDGLTGQTLTLSDFRGKVIVLEFIQPWCPHSKRMVPIMEQLYKRYSDRVVFVSVGGAGLKPINMTNFIGNFNSSLTYAYDSSGTAFNLYGVTAVPTIFIISANGTIAETYTGENSYEILAAAIDQQLSPASA